MKRTHNNGELRLSDVSKEVSLIGWVAKKRNLGNLVFIDLRDRYGYTQLVFDSSFEEITNKIKNEYVLNVKGIVVKRKDANSNLATGEIEVNVTFVNIVNTSELTPFIIADKTDALEDTRLKYRYLDLRRPVMQENLITRHKITKSMRNYLDNLDFIEIETPLLTKATPEGARDYLVPSRINAGKFYALPQSPQLFKQLLMISGLERYYQIARCFRDEDLRSDRQPDFTQLDIETSFMSESEIMDLVEGLFLNILKDVKGYDLKLPLRKFTYKEVMDTYGSDKPDTRLGFELQDVSEIFANNNSDLLKDTAADGTFKAIVGKGLASDLSRKDIDALTLEVKKNGGSFLTFGKVSDNTFTGALTKLVSKEEESELFSKLNLEENDIVFLSAHLSWEKVCKAMGALRNELARRFVSVDKSDYDMLWVVDFPLFEYDEEKGTYTSTHHPFTRPYDEDIKYLDTDPSKVRAHHYDLVMNGYELGSGSLRIYNEAMQKKVFEIIGLSDEEIENQFGFFINAFKYGTPPHGGVAFGLDRIALILTESETIRDVIAFPKNASAVCPMSEAPSLASAKQLKELHIKIEKE
ncbi:TPA: aspartate--tRNA ligase [bacterium]|nr:aspartate--tRNA ligase [bacterium]